MQRRDFFVLSLLCLSIVGRLHAADKLDPTGTWKWSVMVNEQKVDLTLKLKYSDNKLTGTMIGRNNVETKIDDPTYKDGEITFSVTRERDNQKFTTKYKGKQDGDTIKGKSDTELNGQTFNRDWDAKREKE